MDDRSQTQDPYGLWRSRGYGWTLENGPAGFTVSDVTAISNLLTDEGPAASFASAFERLPSEDASTLLLRHRGDVTTYHFEPVDPAGLPPRSAYDAGPLRNFDVLARQFAEHYAFFGLRGVDWEASCQRLRPRLEGAGADDLWDVAAALIAPLKDAHVSIADGERRLDVTSPLGARKAALQAALGIPPWAVDRQGYTDGLAAAFGSLVLNGRFRTTANRMMVFGEIEPGIGYLALFGEFGHADTDRARAALDLPRPRLAAASFLADEIEGLNRGLDEVAAALGGMKALVIDIRLNYGGYDRLALEVASRFTDRRRTAFRKRTWENGSFVVEQDVEFGPVGPSLSHLPVALLTSRQTASAGEILTLALSACPTVQRVGEPTLGILSDNLYKRLPNGWELSLSNESYETPQGEVFEAVGIPPHALAPVVDLSDVASGLRAGAAAAAAFAKSRLP